MPQSEESGQGRHLLRRHWRLVALVGFVLLLGAALIGPPLRIGGRAPPELLAQRDMGRLGKALDRLRADIGRYPTSADGLFLLVKPPYDAETRQSWHGPYLKRDPPFWDPWDQLYHYSPLDAELTAFTLYSEGPPDQWRGAAIQYMPHH